MSDLTSLSPRQREIAELIADGCTDKMIQAKLRISYATIRGHMERIGHKLKLDQGKNIRVLITWLIIDARYEADPRYRLPLPQPEPYAA